MMIKNLSTAIYTSIYVVALSGCIGSSIVLDDDDGQSVDYPSLQTVPDRPARPNFEKMEHDEKQLQEQQSRELKFNQQLRDQVL